MLESGTEGVDGHGNMNVLVGVDTDEDSMLWVTVGLQVRRVSRLDGWEDRTVTGLVSKPGPYSVTARPASRRR
jgi:hypothetical protein